MLRKVPSTLTVYRVALQETINFERGLSWETWNSVVLSLKEEPAWGGQQASWVSGHLTV